jgi:hypothetical protein
MEEPHYQERTHQELLEHGLWSRDFAAYLYHAYDQSTDLKKSCHAKQIPSKPMLQNIYDAMEYHILDFSCIYTDDSAPQYLPEEQRAWQLLEPYCRACLVKLKRMIECHGSLTVDELQTWLTEYIWINNGWNIIGDSVKQRI